MGLMYIIGSRPACSGSLKIITLPESQSLGYGQLSMASLCMRTWNIMKDWQIISTT